MTKSHDSPFYGKVINRKEEEKYIKLLLQKYRYEPVNENLKKKVWDELQMEKHCGRISIPFKLSVRMDPSGKFPALLEVILDTKV